MPSESHSAVAEAYPATTNEEVTAASELMLGDSLFGAPSLFTARHHARAGHPTWLYLVSRFPPADGQTAGAYHGIDLSYVFRSPLPFFPWEPVDDELSDAMVDYWTTFGARGAPTPRGRSAWERFDPARPRWIDFGNVVEMRDVHGLDRYELLERHLITPGIEAAN